MSEKQNSLQTIPPIDYSSVLERIGGDESFLKELLNLYLDDFSKKYKQLQKAIEQKRYDQIREFGHSLKGSSANLSLTFLQKASFQMEIAGKEGNIKQAKGAFEQLKKEFKRLKDFLSK